MRESDSRCLRIPLPFVIFAWEFWKLCIYVKGVIEIFRYRLRFVYISILKHAHSTTKLLKITRSSFEYRFIIHQCRAQTTLFDENRWKFTVKDENKTSWLAAWPAGCQLSRKTCAVMLRGGIESLLSETRRFIFIFYSKFSSILSNEIAVLSNNIHTL